MYKRTERSSQSPLQRRENQFDSLQQKKEQNQTTQTQHEHNQSVIAEPLQQKAIALPMTVDRLQQNSTLQLQTDGETEENAPQAKFKWDQGISQRVEAAAGDTPTRQPPSKPNSKALWAHYKANSTAKREKQMRQAVKKLLLQLSKPN